MTNTYDTSQYPIGSSEVKVLFNNASNLDDGVNSEELTWTDRFGKLRKTFAGIEQDANNALINIGFEFIGDYDANGPLLISRPNQVFSKSGDYWKPGPSLTLPYTTVNNWVVDQPKFVSVGDAALRTALAQPDGSKLSGYKGYTVYDRFAQVVNIKDAPFAVQGNNTTLDHDNLVACLDYAAAQGLPVIVPAGLYQFNNWIPLPDKLKVIFEPGARWKLTAQTTLGGFVCGGYTQALVPRPFTEAEIYGMDLDCNNLPNENGFNALNGVNVKVYNLKVQNVRFSPTNQGGKAVQFEGAIVDGIHTYNTYIENCTIGINSHADPSGGTEVARFITHFNVVMRNVDIPFNCDGQFASPETGNVSNMSTTVRGVNLFNCGKITYPGNSGALGGGIFCGDRGFGLNVSGLRLVNTTAYGAIGSLMRGTLFGLQIDDITVNAPALGNVFDLSPVGYGFPSSGAHPCTIDARDVKIFAGIGLIVKGYANGKMGQSRLEVMIDSTLGVSGLCDLEATSGNLGFLDLTLRNTGSLRTKMQTLSRLYLNGNTVNLCQPEYFEGTWTPVDGSGAGLSFAGASAYCVRESRQVTANMDMVFPVNASGAAAVIGGLLFTAMARAEAGGATFLYKAATTLATGRVVASGNTCAFYTEAGAALPNSALSGQSLSVSFKYFAV